MKLTRRFPLTCLAIAIIFFIGFLLSTGPAAGADLPEIQERGVLRHLGVPYANFVTGSGDGLEVELIQLFAAHLGVDYEYVATDWRDMIGDLTGNQVVFDGKESKVTASVPIKGDLIANGMTILPWRQEFVNFSRPIFQSQIWVVALADAPIDPITPTDDVHQDIAAVKKMVKGYSCIGLPNTCLDPNLYGMAEAGARIVMFNGLLNEIAPAILNHEADLALMDIPDAVMAMEKWPGQLKVIGPLSQVQGMGVAFPKTAPLLEAAFGKFLDRCWADGTYLQLVKKYYPAVVALCPGFFPSH